MFESAPGFQPARSVSREGRGGTVLRCYGATMQLVPITPPSDWSVEQLQITRLY